MRLTPTALPLAVVLAFATLCETVRADEIAAQSKVVAVTVFPSGAEITRSVKLKMARGQHVVVLSDLPAEAVPQSIRVSGKASAQFEIGSVDTRRLKLERTDAASLAAERKAIEDNIERLKDQRSALETLIETAQTQKQLIVNLTELPKRPPPQGSTATISRQDDWSQLIGLIGTSMTEVHRTVLETSVKIRETDRQVRDLEKKLARLAPTPRELTEVKINATAAEPLDADVTVTYLVRNASWTSLYDARLTTGSKTQAPTLTLARRAMVQQRTGEAWTDVNLALSTSRPTQRASAPTLPTQTVDFVPDRPPAPAPVASAQGRGGVFESAPAPARKTVRTQVEQMDHYAREVGAAVESGAFQAVFTPAGRFTIPDTGEAKKLFIDEQPLDPELTARSVPRLDPKAYLYAKSVLPKAAPYLPGQISLFRDGTFVGSDHMPMRAPGAEHEFGFGADDLVRVQYAVVDEKRGESGLISASRTDQRSYKISVKNLHERAIMLSVRDRVPVSLNQDIKVELTGRTMPTKREIDDKRGLLAWESKLEPDAETVIDFGYRVSWPSAKQVRYQR